MSIKDIIRAFSQKEPLNPYQIAGMAALIKESGLYDGRIQGIELESPAETLTILDRSSAEASKYLISARESGNMIMLGPRYSLRDLENLILITSSQGRRKAIGDDLVPSLYELPNWVDVVTSISRHSLDRDDRAMGEKLPFIMDMVLSHLKAAATQPFDEKASAEAEYTILKIMEDIVRTPDPEYAPRYFDFLRESMEFLLNHTLDQGLNSLDRRIPILFPIRSNIAKKESLFGHSLVLFADKMVAKAIIRALSEIKACPGDLVQGLENSVQDVEPGMRDQFLEKIVSRVKRVGTDQIQKVGRGFHQVMDGETGLSDPEIREALKFIRTVGEDWKQIIKDYEILAPNMAYETHEAFASVLARQALSMDKPEISGTLVDGLCHITLRLESMRKLASRELVKNVVSGLLTTLYESVDSKERIMALKAIEAIAGALGRSGYFLLAQDLLDQLLERQLICPEERAYSLEDDDTGEPLVLAEDMEANKVHVRHLKTLLNIVASNPRIMHRLIPYITVQVEMRGAMICDEDLIQYNISKILRANSSITHFPVRVMIKAIPYSFKDIGPLDNLRLTAAGLAKELADRGVKAIGNFLGKLRGDIHWRGSVENFHFAKGILSYLCTGEPDRISEWMPKESIPYLHMSCWAGPVEQDEIRNLCREILRENGMDPDSDETLTNLIELDSEKLRSKYDNGRFSARVVLDMIDLVQGLHDKYFISRESLGSGSVQQDLDSMEKIISERVNLKESYLTPDKPDPLPPVRALTEGAAEYVTELDRLHREAPDTPIISRARKTGHAYAQRGSYIEERFEAFNKDISLEARQETLATSINNTHFAEITEENLGDALRFLDDLARGVRVNGHSSYYLYQTGNDLKTAASLGLTYDKVRDLLKILKHELDDIQLRYNNRFEQPFDDFLSSTETIALPRKLKELTTLNEIPESDFFKNYLKTLYISDLQARDGNLRVLETFLEKVELFLNRRLADSGRVVSQKGSKRYEPAPFYFPDQGELSPCKIGLKASLLRFAENTPPYFVITTDRPMVPPVLYTRDHEFRHGFAQAIRKLESLWGRGFGDPRNPALLSVRSGGRISMPGMMTTITNVGVNDEIAESLAKIVGRWFAYDCYRRFLQEFSQAVFGVTRDEFQDIIDERKRRWRVSRKAEMSGDQMMRLAFDYKGRVSQLAPDATAMLDEGRFLDILTLSATAVMESYEGRAAQKYRQAAGIDGDWRTPVIVQAMVYGNMEMGTSGAGVVTYSPFTMELRGEFSYGDQGADVVDGKVVTIPVYDLWKQVETMASTMPDQWKQLSSMLYRISEKLSLDVGLEYTVEKGVVYVLQIRKQKKRPVEMRSLSESDYNVIARGAGVSGNIFRGIMVTESSQIAPYRHLAKANSIIQAMNKDLPDNEKLDGFIFVVNDPIPEEVMEEVFSLPVATALVSRLGGRGAHVGDIAKSLGKVYVGQVNNLEKFFGRPSQLKFGQTRVLVGAKMIIHGQTGEIALYKSSGSG